jgi:ribose transport system substrate-binding protein
MEEKMFKKTTFSLISLLVIGGMVLGACQSAAPAEPTEAKLMPTPEFTSGPLESTKEAEATAPAAAEEPSVIQPMEIEGNVVVAFSNAAMENEARIMIQRDLENQVKAAGYDFIWTNAAGDPAKQLADVEDLLSKKPNLLILAPVESEPLATVPDKCMEAGVPLMLIDRSIPGTPGTGAYLALLTNDFKKAGKDLFADMVETVKKEKGEAKANVVHITGQSGSSPAQDIQKGIDEVLAENPDINIIVTCDGLWQAEPSRKCAEDALQRFPAGEIDVIFSDSDTEGLGALEAVKTAGRTELLGWIWGRDGSKPWLEAMLAGDVSSTSQVILFYGSLAMQLYEQWLIDGKPIDPPVFGANGEFFNNHDEAGIERVKERIEELDALGIGCCYLK